MEETRLVGAPLDGKPIPVAWGDGGVQSEWRPAEIGAAVYDEMGVYVCMCVCAPEEWFSLWLILHTHLAALEGGALRGEKGRTYTGPLCLSLAKVTGRGRGEVLASVLHRPVKKKNQPTRANMRELTSFVKQEC